jgi:riboflavin synthase
MFTGLVQGVGRVRGVEMRGASGPARLTIDPRWDVPVGTLEAGESISVSGVCLTLVGDAGGRSHEGPLAFDVVQETLDRTTLGGLLPGARVNLERSLRASDLMGGHGVQGHIDGIGTVERVQTGSDWRVWVRPEVDDERPAFMQFVVPKGSICVDGVSLTIAGVTGNPPKLFDVALIPTTLARTTLGDLRPGDRVNLESDVVVRTIVHYLRHYGGGDTSGREA